MSISKNLQNLLETKLIYLEDTYLFQYRAILLDIIQNENFDNKQILVLDKTIFYPQGGGQPSDTGIISSIDKSAIFIVEKTIFNSNGQVWHIGNFEAGDFEINQKLQLEIDAEKRLINSKNHSAGHLLNCAIESLGVNLKAVKGYHFLQGPYVEYMGDLEITEELKSKIESKANEIINQNVSINFVMENDKHESGKPMRIMQIAGFTDCPCGGTHVRNSKEIGKIKIRKITKKPPIIKISYQIES